MTGRLLVAYSNASNHVATTAEYLGCISRYSKFEVRYVHVTNDADLDFDLNEFDAIFQSYCVRLPFDNYVSPSYIAKMKSFRGVKLLAVQDEYDHTNKLKSAMQEIGYHVLLTNVPQSMIERIYPHHQFARTEFITVLTGYVPERLAERGKAAPSLSARPIHIGYRGRKLDAHYGRLAFDKLEIGRRMREICRARGIPHDIEWADDKRIYGDAWYAFIGSCRATLGSETGSNVFDFDGTIKSTYQKLAAERGGPVPFAEFRAYTDPIEAQYDIAQISPRIFEAAAMRTPLILFPGRYLGLIEPDEHYLELKKDFSNIDEVLARLDDLDALERMAARAHDRLIGSGDFGYQRFAELIDATILRKAAELGVKLRSASGRPRFAGGGVDLAALATLREVPSEAPRHFAYFQYKQLAQHNNVLTNEITRLNQVYTAEITRLNAVLTEETARLNAVYTTEIARLQDVILEITKPGASHQKRTAIRRILKRPISRRAYHLARRLVRLRSRLSTTELSL